MTTPRKALVTRIQRELFSGGRLELIEALYVPSLRETVTRLVTMMRTAFPDLDVAIDHLIAEGDEVACRWTATGTQQDWFHTVPPTGARVSWSGISMYAFEPDGDRVAGVVSSSDVFGLMQQLRAALR